MKFVPTQLPGAFIIELEPITDERGFFARTFCQSEFAAWGLNTSVAQMNTSFNRRRGTLRGMHFQLAPHAETKIVRVTQGAIYDVIIDLRPDSPTFKQWVSAELSAENQRQLYIPQGMAHGFQTLTDDAELLYLMGTAYVPGASSGVRYDDPTFSIRWPLPIASVSDKDANFQDFEC